MSGGKAIINGTMARRFASWLLLAALLLRGLIPGGFMPNLDPANGQGWLVICTSAGERTVLLDADGTAHQAPADTQQHGLCAFALLGGWAPVLLLVALLLGPLPRRILPACREVATRLRTLFCAPPGARAPPLAA